MSSGRLPPVPGRYRRVHDAEGPPLIPRQRSCGAWDVGILAGVLALLAVLLATSPARAAHEIAGATQWYADGTYADVAEVGGQTAVSYPAGTTAYGSLTVSALGSAYEAWGVYVWCQRGVDGADYYQDETLPATGGYGERTASFVLTDEADMCGANVSLDGGTLDPDTSVTIADAFLWFVAEAEPTPAPTMQTVALSQPDRDLLTLNAFVLFVFAGFALFALGFGITRGFGRR